jgi:hypothetical protein
MGLIDTSSAIWQRQRLFDTSDTSQDSWEEFQYRTLAGNGNTWGGGLIQWSDEGNRNQHEPRVKGKTDGREYNALTDAALLITADKDRGQIDVHYIIDVRYSDNVGPHNKEKQKLEPAHGNEIDRDFKMNRAPKILDNLTRRGGPIWGQSLEMQRSMVKHALEPAFKDVWRASHDRHDYYDRWNPYRGPHGDHVIIHPDGLDY